MLSGDEREKVQDFSKGLETLGELNKFSTRNQKDCKSFLLGDEIVFCREVSENDESYIDEVKNLRIPTTVFSCDAAINSPQPSARDIGP